MNAKTSISRNDPTQIARIQVVPSRGPRAATPIDGDAQDRGDRVADESQLRVALGDAGEIEDERAGRGGDADRQQQEGRGSEAALQRRDQRRQQDRRDRTDKQADDWRQG